MSKLTKSEKQELREMIKFQNGIVNKDLEQKFIDFMNEKYRQKYKQNDDKYEYIISQLPPDSDRAVMEDNEFYERVSVILYQESTRDRKSRGINSKNDSYNIEPVGSHDIGEKRQYSPFYQMNGQKIYLTFESSDNYSEESKTRWEIESVYAQKYSETERVIDEAINAIFERYKASSNKNEILYRLLVNLNKEPLDYFSYQALVLFLNQELKNYRIIPNQQKIIDRIILAGEIPDANQKKVLKRLLNIPKKK